MIVLSLALSAQQTLANEGGSSGGGADESVIEVDPQIKAAAAAGLACFEDGPCVDRFTVVKETIDYTDKTQGYSVKIHVKLGKKMVCVNQSGTLVKFNTHLDNLNNSQKYQLPTLIDSTCHSKLCSSMEDAIEKAKSVAGELGGYPFSYRVSYYNPEKRQIGTSHEAVVGRVVASISLNAASETYGKCEP